MKKTFILFLFLSLSAFATDISNPFVDGNNYYKSGKYEAAISSYGGILSSGQQSFELYFNLGNCYYKLHQVAPAIYNFEKALLVNPDDVDAKTNLEYAKKLKIDEIKEIPKVGFSKLLQDFTSSYSYDAWAWTAIVLAFLFLLFFLGYYFSSKAIVKRTFFTGMFLLLIGIVATVSAGIFEKNRYYNDKPAIVFAEITLLKSEPKISGKTRFTLHEGTKVAVLESRTNWKKVQLSDETVGWVESDAIRELK
jgi:tetratricopeptide (TPR) repeat protein